VLPFYFLELDTTSTTSQLSANRVQAWWPDRTL